MVVISQLMAGMNNDTTTNTICGHLAKESQRVSCSFHHQGKPICKKMLKYFHTLGGTRYKNLKKSLQSQELATRAHSNLKRSPAHALSLSSTEFIVRFHLNYAKQNVLNLPGRIPGYSQSDMKLLPSSVSKHGGCTRKLQGVMRYMLWPTPPLPFSGTLSSLWKPMTDVCWQCQKESTANSIQQTCRMKRNQLLFSLLMSTSELCR